MWPEQIDTLQTPPATGARTSSFRMAAVYGVIGGDGLKGKREF